MSSLVAVCHRDALAARITAAPIPPLISHRNVPPSFDNFLFVKNFAKIFLSNTTETTGTATNKKAPQRILEALFP